MLGLDNAFVHGEPVRAALPAWPELVERSEKRLRGGEKLLLERDGRRYIDTRITDPRGGRLVVLRDVSEIKRIESELRAANEDLRQKLVETEALQAKLKALTQV